MGKSQKDNRHDMSDDEPALEGYERYVLYDLYVCFVFIAFNGGTEFEPSSIERNTRFSK